MVENIKITIEKLLKYARCHLHLDPLDEVYFRNRLLQMLDVDSPLDEEVELDGIEELKVPDTILDEVKAYLVEKGEEHPDLKLVEIMGLLSPLPSQVASKVNELEKEEAGKGLDYLFDLSIKNNYIQKTAIDRNIYFRKDYEDNFLEITINLSKPEKNNKDIAKLLVKTNNVKYPKCLLCKENLGYAGRTDHPARENIRILPLKLNGENWFLQYSPYAYFDHHAIVINDNHSNMSINNTTFLKLLEFVDQYPTFFIGSNADLPIVGGSILNHEHYQGGLHLLPVFYSHDRKVFYEDKEVKVSSLEWYNSVIRVEGTSMDRVVEIARKVFNSWKDYDDASVEILSHTGETRHSTVTPIARKVGNKYQLNLILRNNRCDETYPDGIFHAHPEYHHIKQEGIGLIEAMGLFILPPRLKRQMGYIEELLQGNDEVSSYFAKYNDLEIHRTMVEDLVREVGRGLSQEKAHEAINDYIAETCKNILCNTAVFKNDEQGRQALDKFMSEVIK